MPSDSTTVTPQTPSLINSGEPAPQQEPIAEPKPDAAPTEEKPQETRDPALDTKANPFKPEEIKFSNAELTIDPEVAGEFSSIVNEFGIPRDAIAKLVALQEKTMSAASEAGSRSWNELQDRWQNEVKADKEIGGPALTANLARIGQLLDTYGSPEVRAALDLTGAGNNPAIVKFMSKIASALTEGGFVSGNLPSSGPADAASILYPNQGKE